MNPDILRRLQGTTIEEQAILDGRTTIDRDIYMQGQSNTINSRKLLSSGKLITIRPHTRFIHFPEHTHDYVEVEDILNIARAKDEDPFIILLDGITDPHNLGAILRTAECAGAHGVIIPKRRNATLSYVVGKTSAGAIEYMPVARVTNIVKTMEMLKKEGLWFVCADMGGEIMYNLNLKGAIGLVIGNEGEGVSRLVKENCDFVASIPMKGDIDSLNASVATGVLAYEIVRQRLQ